MASKPNDNIPYSLLISLANEVKFKIQINKYLLETIKIYQNQISEIKNVFKYKNNSNINDNNAIFISEYIKNLDELKIRYSKEIIKLNEKNNEYKKQLSNDTSNGLLLEKEKSDNFILKNALKKLDDEISLYDMQMKKSKNNSIFQEGKRDKIINKKESENLIYYVNISLQRDLLLENRYYSKCVYKTRAYEKKIKQMKKIIEELKNFIEAIKKYLDKVPLLKRYESKTNIFQEQEFKFQKNVIKNRNKKFQEDEDDSEFNKMKKMPRKKNNKSKEKIINHYNYYFGKEDSTNDGKGKDKNENNNSFYEIRSKNIKLPLINKSSEEDEEEESEYIFPENIRDNKSKNNAKKKNKREDIKTKKRLDFLSLDELFDLSNFEGKNEEIIDEELHSEEDNFESKVKPEKKIINNYINQIKKEIPTLNLTQIEYNKEKVMNEADLYSLQKRNFEENNIHAQTNHIKKKLKKMKKKIELNRKKYYAIRSFIQETKNNYSKILRPLKIKSTVEGRDIDFKIQDLFYKKDKDKTKNDIIQKSTIKEEELVGSDYSDEDKYEEDNAQPVEINIVPDDDDSEDSPYMKTQAEIKTNIKLNLLHDNNEKSDKKHRKLYFYDNSNYNSK